MNDSKLTGQTIPATCDASNIGSPTWCSTVTPGMDDGECDFDCTYIRCGDGHVNRQGGEQCDSPSSVCTGGSNDGQACGTDQLVADCHLGGGVCNSPGCFNCQLPHNCYYDCPVNEDCEYQIGQHSCDDYRLCSLPCEEPNCGCAPTATCTEDPEYGSFTCIGACETVDPILICSCSVDSDCPIGECCNTAAGTCNANACPVSSSSSISSSSSSSCPAHYFITSALECRICDLAWMMANWDGNDPTCCPCLASSSSSSSSSPLATTSSSSSSPVATTSSSSSSSPLATTSSSSSSPVATTSSSSSSSPLATTSSSSSSPVATTSSSSSSSSFATTSSSSSSPVATSSSSSTPLSTLSSQTSSSLSSIFSNTTSSSSSTISSSSIATCASCASTLCSPCFDGSPAVCTDDSNGCARCDCPNSSSSSSSAPKCDTLCTPAMCAACGGQICAVHPDVPSPECFSPATAASRPDWLVCPCEGSSSSSISSNSVGSQSSNTCPTAEEVIELCTLPETCPDPERPICRTFVQGGASGNVCPYSTCCIPDDYILPPSDCSACKASHLTVSADLDSNGDVEIYRHAYPGSIYLQAGTTMQLLRCNYETEKEIPSGIRLKSSLPAGAADVNADGILDILYVEKENLYCSDYIPGWKTFAYDGKQLLQGRLVTIEVVGFNDSLGYWVEEWFRYLRNPSSFTTRPTIPAGLIPPSLNTNLPSCSSSSSSAQSSINPTNPFIPTNPFTPTQPFTPQDPTSFNPTSFKPDSFNPDSFNPTSFNPTSFNPTSFTPTSFNPDSFNPTSFNPTNPFTPLSPTSPFSPVSPSGPTNPCSNDTDCPENLICENGECTNGCRNNNDCPIGICLNGSCTPCNDSRDCSTGFACNANGQCSEVPTPGCSTNNDCPEGSLCKNGNCLPCYLDEHCKTGFSCLDNICTAVGSLCGNQQLDPTEQCDDGNTFSGDGCSSVCTLEYTNICGNGIREFPEDCDDSNTINNDGCSSSCKREITLVAGIDICGDGLIGDNEECDDSNTRDLDGCSSVCLLEQGICGDGIVQRGLNEQCEPTLHDQTLPYSCTTSCRYQSTLCGNGTIDAGEQCDEGNQNSDRANEGCRTDCSQSRCGDSIVDTANQEACDDGNKLNGDGCTSTCQIEHSASVQFTSMNPNNTPQPIRLPLATLTQQPRGPVGDTGPAAIVFMASGAAVGIGWVRRRKRKGGMT